MNFDIVIYILIVLIIYKILDRLIRIPRIGNYHNRYIFITGCDTGFGNLLAKRLDQLGCHVFAGCLTEKGETELKKVSSDRLHAVSLDVTKQESVRKAFDYVKSKLPQGKGLWGVVNNAGSVYKSGPVDWLSVDDFKKQCDVNLWGAIDVALVFLPLVKIEKGRVVNMSSAAGRISLPATTVYCLSKYGVEAFSDGLRLTLNNFGCKTIIIEPGGFKTPGSTKEIFSDSFTRGWESASPEVKAEYGDEYANFLREYLPAKIESTLSSRTDLVVDAYEHALFGLYPRARYAVGFDINFIHIPLSVLPEWFSDWFMKLVQSSANQKMAVSRKK